MKSFRNLCAVLFGVSLLALTSCYRSSTYDSCSPCGNSSPCAVNSCESKSSCSPCGPSYTAPCGGSSYVAPCSTSSSCDSNVRNSCGSENSVGMCGPDFFPCATGQCGNSNTCEPSSCGPEVCYRNMREYSTCDDCVVYLTQRSPEFATVGSPYPICLQITAVKECADVVVNQTLPCDSAFMGSSPEAVPQGRDLTWRFPHLEQGESATVTVWVKPEREGCCLSTATVCACPQLCAYTNCGQPILCIKKCGPACACVNCPINYVIDICNSGSAPAYEVVVLDNVPEGLNHKSGQRCLRYEIGTLCPGESKRITADFCASRPGKVCNIASVSYCGGPECTAEACTIIYQPAIQVTKSGPDWSYLCKTVDYTITVTNPSDLILREVVVDDISPAGVTIVDAPGANICCNRAVWCLPELCPGESRTLKLSVRSQVTGNLCNRVTVTGQSDCGPATDCAEACTVWRGIPAISMCMVDTCDPICIGDTTVYRVCINNKGTAEDHNVQLSIRFTEELQPQATNGPTQGAIRGHTVTFAPLQTLSPKQSVEYSVVARGVSSGDGRAEAILSSDGLPAPVTDIENTHVY